MILKTHKHTICNVALPDKYVKTNLPMFPNPVNSCSGSFHALILTTMTQNKLGLSTALLTLQTDQKCTFQSANQDLENSIQTLFSSRYKSYWFRSYRFQKTEQVLILLQLSQLTQHFKVPCLLQFMCRSLNNSCICSVK